MAANPTMIHSRPTLESVCRCRILAIGVDPAICAALSVPDIQLVLAAPGHEAAAALEAWTQDQAIFDAVLCNVRERDASGVFAYRAVVRARPDLADRFVFVVDEGATPRRHYLLGEIDNPAVDAGIDARVLRAIVRGM